MATNQEVSSILAADFGSVHTRLVLIDVVEGKYRLVARGKSRTTDGHPVYDISAGFERVLTQVTDATGRKFTSPAGEVIVPQQADDSGVDLFALTVSLGRPLRAVVVGLIPGVSIASAIRAASGTYIEVATTIHLDDGRDREQRLNAIVLSYPDVVIIAGGTEGGAKTGVLQLAEITRFAISLLDRARRPTVIYTGNSDIADEIQALFENETRILIAENVRPSLDVERFDSVRQSLSAAFDRYKESRSEDFALIGAMSQTGVLPTGQSYAIIADYLGRMREDTVVLVDIGSASSTLAVSMDQHLITSIRTDLGLGHSAPPLLDAIGVPEVRHYLPFSVTESEMRNYVLNKSLRPATIPMTTRDLYLEHGLLRAAGRELLAGANLEWGSKHLSADLVIGAGSTLTNTGYPGLDALLLLDVVQPLGITELQLDPFGLIAACGAIATRSPEAVVQLMEGGNLVKLGTAFSLGGLIRQDRQAMRVEILLEHGEKIQETIDGGHVWIYPLPANHTAQVTIRCASDTSINGRRGVKLTVSGGRVGLIFDARGRPLALADSVKGRAAQMPHWLAEVTGQAVKEIDVRLLDGTEDVSELPDFSDIPGEEEPKSGRRSRGGRQGRRGRRDKAAGVDVRDVFDLPDDLDDTFDLDKNELRQNADDELDELRNVLS